MTYEVQREDMLASNPGNTAEILKEKHIFIAGAGGLGSNVALLLTRAGVGKITIVDFDHVDASNLNRQQYFYDQLGQPKVEALKENLSRISPFVEINTVIAKLTCDNFSEIIPADTDLIYECFDNPVCKADLVRYCLSQRPETPTVAVSGIAGDGPVDTITTKKQFGNLYMVGDDSTDANDLGTLATRVMVGASIQAHAGVMLLCHGTID